MKGTPKNMTDDPKHVTLALLLGWKYNPRDPFHSWYRRRNATDPPYDNFSLNDQFPISFGSLCTYAITASDAVAHDTGAEHE